MTPHITYIGQQCKGGCGRTLVPYKKYAPYKADMPLPPGTARHRSRGLCVRCESADRLRRGTKVHNVLEPTEDDIFECSECSSLTVRHYRKQYGTFKQCGNMERLLCRTCNNHRLGNSQPRRKTPKECADCHRPFRRGAETIKDRPGTVQVRRDGRCSRCNAMRHV